MKTPVALTSGKTRSSFTAGGRPFSTSVPLTSALLSIEKPRNHKEPMFCLVLNVVFAARFRGQHNSPACFIAKSVLLPSLSLLSVPSAPADSLVDEHTNTLAADQGIPNHQPGVDPGRQHSGSGAAAGFTA